MNTNSPVTNDIRAAIVHITIVTLSDLILYLVFLVTIKFPFNIFHKQDQKSRCDTSNNVQSNIHSTSSLFTDDYVNKVTFFMRHIVKFMK